MKKILFFIHDLGPGGAEKVLVNLVNHLNPERFDVSVTALFGGGVNEQFLKPHIHYKAVYPKAIPGNSHIMKALSPKRLHQMYVKEHYDIEVSYLEGPSARVISGCTDPATKLVAWIHGEQHEKRIAARSFRRYREALVCYRRFDRTVCVSETVRQDFCSLFPLERPVEVLYNTNETDQILRLKDEPVEGGTFRDDEIKLVGVGKVTLNKGFDRLARIHKRLREEGYPVHTYILGVGPQQEEIQRYVEENGLADSFTFLGYQTNPYKYVARCDLFVCASHSEGFSTAATEALIVGTPVCTVEVSGMREMLGENDEWGVVTENNEEALYEGIKRMLSETGLIAAYKERAAARGKAFSKEQTVQAVEEMFLNL